MLLQGMGGGMQNGMSGSGMMGGQQGYNQGNYG